MENCFAIEDLIPVVDPDAYVHPTAVLIGDVTVGPCCYVGPGASLRGDFGRITVREGANVQDNCTLHGFPEGETIIDVDGHIGHGAVIHGAHVGRNALIGMNAVVMDEAKIGESAVVGAMAFVPDGTVIPPRSLAVGIPVRVLRELTETEISWKQGGTRDYQKLVERSLESMRRVQPLTKPQADRPRFTGGTSQTLSTVRAQRDERAS